MTPLRAEQIATGVKNVKPGPPPDADRPGKWRCCLCTTGKKTKWSRGTLRDAITHYLAAHHDTEEAGG